MLVCLAKAATTAAATTATAMHCRDHRYRQHSGHRKREHRIGDRQKPNAVRQQWWLADDVEVHPIARRDHPLGRKAPRRCMPPRCPRRDRHVGWAVGGYPGRACSPESLLSTPRRDTRRLER
ncbi:unnamed protein product [Ectocarpus sp. 8 AP-2014]